MSAKGIDSAALYEWATAEIMAQVTEQILADPDAYECFACQIEGERCDVGLAVRLERERIIELLEKQLEKAELEISLSNIDLPKIIELIKGENK